jgi:hypothetical protein
MGNLTNDMTRLRGEVDALRSDRGALMQDLARGAKNLASTVSAMQAGFAAAHTAMAKKTSRERCDFVAGVISDVNSLLGAFSQDRNDMARKGRHDRGVFLLEMKKQVTGMCKETAGDLMEARIAWRGQSPRKSRPVQLKKEPVAVKPLSPTVEAALKKTSAAPELKAKKPPVTFWEPLKKEKGTEAAAALKAPAVEHPRAKAPQSVSASKPFQKNKDWMKITPKR